MTNTYYIRVVVDPSGALKGIDAIAKALGGLSAAASKVIRITVDTAKAVREVVALEQALRGLSTRKAVNVAVNVEDALKGIDALSATLRWISKTRYTIQVTVDTASAMKGFDALGRSLRWIVFGGHVVKVNVDVTSALQGVDALGKSLRWLVQHTPTVRVNLDAGPAFAALESLQKTLNWLIKHTPTIRVSVEATGALGAFDALQRNLNWLLKYSPTIKVSVDAAHAFQVLDAIQKQFHWLAKYTPTLRISVDAVGAFKALDSINKNLNWLMGVNQRRGLSITVDSSQAHAKIDAVSVALRRLHAQASRPLMLRFDTATTASGLAEVTRNVKRLSQIVERLNSSLAATPGLMQGASNKSNSMGSMGPNLNRLLAVGGTSIGVGSVVKLSDAYTDLENKVRNASSKNDELGASMNAVFAAANRSRTGVETFGKSVLTISGATESMNLGFATSIRMAETLSKMLQVGGATTQEAKSTQLQYGQALRSGKLQGEEFRSVMEHSVELQRALAKAMGITTGELKAQSKAGNINREVMVKALLDNAEAMDLAYARMKMTIGSAMTVVRNEAIRFMGSLKLNETFAPMLLTLAKNFHLVGKAALFAASIVAIHFAQRAMGAAVTGVVAFVSSLKKLTFTRVFSMLSISVLGLVAAMGTLLRDVKVAEGSMATWGDVAGVVVSSIKTALVDLGRLVLDTSAAISGVSSVTEVTFGNVLREFAFFGDSLINAAVLIKDLIVTIFGGIGAGIAEGMYGAINLAIDAANELEIRFSKTGDFFKKELWQHKSKYAQRPGGNVVPPMDPKDPYWIDPSAVPGYVPGRSLTGDAAKGLGLAPGRGLIRSSRSPQAEAAARGFSEDVYEFAARTRSTLNDAAARIEAGGLGTPEYTGSFKRLENPYAGATAAIPKKLIEDWNKSMEKGILEKGLDASLRKAETEASGKLLKKSVYGIFGFKETGTRDSDGQKQRTPVSDTEVKKTEEARKAWDGLRLSVNGVTKAENELAEAQSIIDTARSRGIKISAEQEFVIMARKKAMLQDQLDPYAAIMRSIDEQIEGHRILAGEGETQLAVVKKRNELWEKGAFITQTQVSLMERQMLLERGLSDSQKRKNSLLSSVNYVSADEQRSRALASAKLSSSTDTEFNLKASIIENSTFIGRVETAVDQYVLSVRDAIEIGKQWTAEGRAQNDVLRTQAALFEKLDPGAAAKSEMLKSAGYVSPEDQKLRALGNARIMATSEENFARRSREIEATNFLPKFETDADRYAQALTYINEQTTTWIRQGYDQNTVLSLRQRLLADVNKEFGKISESQSLVQQLNAGLLQGLRDVYKEFGNTSGQVADLTSETFTQMKDALVDFGSNLTWDDIQDGLSGFIDLLSDPGWDKAAEGLRGLQNAFEGFIDSLLKGMMEVAAQRLIFEIMGIFLGSATGGGGGALAAAGGGGGGSGIIGSILDSALKKNAQGGVFKVSGPPGTDNVLVPPMWLTAGEHMAIWPKGQDPNESARAPAPVQQQGGTNVIVVRNEREAALAVMQSPAGRRTQIKNLSYSEAYLRTLQAKS